MTIAAVANRWWVESAAVGVILAVVVRAMAAGDRSAIDVTALPGDPAVRQAWADALAQEPYASSWSPEWKHQVPKEAVARVLAASLATLRRAAESDDRTELLLAVGLTARYAHNVDVDGAADVGFDALKKAAARPGNDPRPEWFLGMSLCVTTSNQEAMAHLQAAEARAGRKALPADYWRQVLFCAGVSGMPAHAVRAGRELDRQGLATPLDKDMAGRARKLLEDPDPATEIPRDKAWGLTSIGGKEALASRTCGFAFELDPKREWSALPVKNGTCVAHGSLGSFPGKRGIVIPSVLIMARPAREGETADAFASSLEYLADRVAVDGFPCPSQVCRSFEVRHPEAYAPEGGGVVVAVIFEREEPETRGLALESARPPRPDALGKVQYFRPLPRLVRFRGRLFYLVLLDTAKSVAESAEADYRRFLAGLVVE